LSSQSGSADLTVLERIFTTWISDVPMRPVGDSMNARETCQELPQRNTVIARWKTEGNFLLQKIDMQKNEN
jgi:hypothetical protein